MQIIEWVLQENPDCTVITEQVVFSDMTDHWNQVCERIGVPLVINAADVSYTRRMRAYWVWNLDVNADDFIFPDPPLNPNNCMDAERQIMPKYPSKPMLPHNVGML